MYSSKTGITTPIMNVMVSTVMKVARKLIRDFNEVEHLQVSHKGAGKFVTNADLNCEKELRIELEKARPEYGFLMEESGEVKGQDPSFRWIIDPIDGTKNFLHGYPHFAISLALQKDNEIIAGVIYDPVKDELFCAEKGRGAFMNDRRIRVSSRKFLKEALVSVGLTVLTTTNSNMSPATIHKKLGGLRCSGSTALDLAYVAAGRLEGFVCMHTHTWDFAAGLILVKEAGGLISQIDGRVKEINDGNLIAGNSALFNDFRAVFNV